MSENLLIRVDSNPEIASGHLMRCLSIAEEARREGLEVSFLMSDDRNREFVQKRGFNYHNLDTDWRFLDFEISKVKNILATVPKSVLLIDTYSITAAYVRAIMQYLPVIYLGSKQKDIGNPDGIINYSSQINYDFYKKNCKDSQLLLGVKYAPLRNEFQNKTTTVSQDLTDLLLTAGGADKPGFSLSFIKSNIEFINRMNINCHVVVGGMFENVSLMEKLSSRSSHVKIHRNVNNMAELMKSCQLAVSANGTTVYELAACGIPTVSFALVREQEASGKALGEMGVVDYCGLYYGNELDCLRIVSEKINYYADNPEERCRLGKRANSMIDGKGSKYIVDFIKKIIKEW